MRSQMKMALTAVFLGWFVAQPLLAAEVKVVLPLARSAYQTNEWIDIAVVRSSPQALVAGNLILTVTGEDASVMTFTFPVKGVPVVGADARATEKLQLDGWLLRPGFYTIRAMADDATAEVRIGVYNHVRRSSYRTVHWGNPRGEALAYEGEYGMGFNLAMGGVEEPSIRGGVDIMGSCLMGGGHQHDLKLTNDWSDPYVYIGAVQRGVDRAFSFRTMPNAIGAHLHDEPGLTWAKHPHTGVFGDADIAQQRDAYQRAFGVEQKWADQLDLNKPEDLAAWSQLNDFRLGFMDAFWRSADQVLSRMKPGYLAVTQSQYGVWALFDGYYFNVVRSLPVVSGHGGYNDFLLRTFNPSLFLEFALPRQWDKPTWYLPEWYDLDPAQFRLEHNLSFITGIQGISAPPGLSINSKGAAGIIESNQLMAKYGTIFTKPEYTRADVAILMSKSNAYKVAGYPVWQLSTVYLATKMTQYPITVVLDEDVIDGTLASGHKAVVLIAIKYLDPAVKAGLEAFAAGGGTVIVGDECTVQIAGATKLGMPVEDIGAKFKEALDKITDVDKKKTEGTRLNSFQNLLDITAPLAKTLKAVLLKAGVAPAFESDNMGIAAGRQVRGEIEYVFAVNFTPDGVGAGGIGAPRATDAKIALPDDGRPLYAIIPAVQAPFAKAGKTLAASVHFGPGQMRTWVRTARPLGGVVVGAPTVTRDLTRIENPVTVDFAATLVGADGKILAGTAPLQITVTDPFGGLRQDLYRATDKGVCGLSLPLAANDPAGAWTVTVKELITGKSSSASFTYKPAAQCGAMAGATPRAVYFAPDKANVYRFFRDQRNVIIVKGSSDYTSAAAERLATALKPYNVTCTIITAAEANKPRELSELEAATWCGDRAAGSLKPGRANDPTVVGYDLPGPSVLLGSPADNPLIKYLADNKILPYALTADFPGRGSGMIAWTQQVLGHDLESIAVVATDAAGLNEAIGTLFQLAVGLDPVTPLTLPVLSTVKAAAQPVPAAPAAVVTSSVVLSDRAATIAAAGSDLVVTTVDGQVSTVNPKTGAVTVKAAGATPVVAKPSTDVKALPKDKLVRDAVVKEVLAGDGITAVAYWGGTVQTFDAAGAEKTRQRLPADIAAMAWVGDQLAIGLADATVLTLKTK